METEKKKKGNILMWILLVLFPPVGIIYMWIAKKHFTTMKKIILTIIFALWFCFSLFVGNDTNSSNTASSPSDESESAENVEEPAEYPLNSDASVEENEDKPSAETETSEGSVAEESLTLGQQNALDKAHDYLDYTSFSYAGLIEQLEYEGFTTEESTFAADNCGADWLEQAELKAQEYLDYTSFSKAGLAEQLEFEGFTSDEAEHAAENCGADWNEQAAKKAQEYLDYSSFSRESLIDQLEFEGFTAAEAEYGVSAVGY